MLELDPSKRMTTKEALNHPYFKENHYPLKCAPNELPRIEKDTHEYQSRQEKQNGKDKEKDNKQNNKFNPQQKQQNKGDMIVAKQSYNNNYYSKNNNRQDGRGLKIDESQVQVSQTSGSLISNFQPNSRLEALLNQNSSSSSAMININVSSTDTTLLQNKRYIEPPTMEERDSQSYKKHRSEQEQFSPTQN